MWYIIIMKRFIIFVLVTFCLVMSFDGNNLKKLDDASNGRTLDTAIPFPKEKTWVNGNISPGEVQWFCFTTSKASDSNCLWIKCDWGTLNDENVQIGDKRDPVMNVQIFDDNGDPAMLILSEYECYTRTFSFAFPDYLNTGRTYYVKVSPYSGYGKYRIQYSIFGELVTCF